MGTAAVDQSTGLAEPVKIPDAARTAAAKYADPVDGAYAKTKAMADGLKAAGHLSHGATSEQPSASGHGLDRLARLLTDPQAVGDQEQFAPALSMMLWSEGIPNRVVMGFRTGRHGGAPVTVTGGDVTAWVEVPFVDHGWVAFDPTPDQSSKAPQPTPQQQSAPKPQVVQPPPPPPPPAQADSSDVDQGRSSDKDTNNPDRKKDQPVAPPSAGPGWALGFGSAGLLLVLGLAIGPVLWLKARRRSRREHAAAGASRIAGGWNQILDAAVDLGHRLPVGSTRAETAAGVDQRFGTGTVLLARRADEKVFGPGPVDEAQSALFWVEVDAAMLGLQSGFGRWRRLRAKLSIASLRRKDQRT